MYEIHKYSERLREYMESRCSKLNDPIISYRARTLSHVHRADENKQTNDSAFDNADAARARALPFPRECGVSLLI